nr:MAG TPA: hypothetical protein [Caudoviricetes sp.]
MINPDFKLHRSKFIPRKDVEPDLSKKAVKQKECF